MLMYFPLLTERDRNGYGTIAHVKITSIILYNQPAGTSINSGKAPPNGICREAAPYSPVASPEGKRGSGGGNPSGLRNSELGFPPPSRTVRCGGDLIRHGASRRTTFPKGEGKEAWQLSLRASHPPRKRHLNAALLISLPKPTIAFIIERKGGWRA